MNRRERLERLYLSFFAAPSDGTTASFFRIGFALLAVQQAVAIWLNLYRFWGFDGMIPYETVANDKYRFVGAFYWAPKSNTLLEVLAIAFTVATACVLVGFRARIFTLVLAYLHLSFQFRNPFILNSGDRLFMIIAALAAFMPLSHRFSVDAWLRKRGGQPTPAATVWGQRLIGMQIAYVYLNSFVAKIGNKGWWGGTALRDVLASPVFAEWPHYFEVGPLIWFLTYSTLVLELAFPVLVWFKRFRPYLLVSGVLFHLSIDVTMVIPIFSYIMIASYPAFLSDADTRKLLAFVFRRGRPEAATA